MPQFDDVNVGDHLPVLTKAPDRAQLVLYCAGSGDFNPLQWDQSFRQAQAIGDNIVHGRMKWSSLGQLVSDWVGSDGWIRSVSCQYRGMDPQGTEWTVRGTVTASVRSTVARKSTSTCGRRTPPGSERRPERLSPS